MKVETFPFPKRGKRKKTKISVAKFDTYSVDETLATIAYPLLKKLKKYKKGTPISVYIKMFSSDDLRKEKKKWKLADKEWNRIFDEIIWTMKEISEDYPLGRTFISEKGVDRDGTNAYNNRITEGLKLFGEFFSDLWW